jgi:myosin heavy subunit
MAITETITNLLEKVLTIGTPPEKEVLYKEVVKRKAPKESAEKLMIDDIKNSIKKMFSTPDNVEFARGTPTPPVKKVAKKKTTAKKTASKKATSTTAKKKTTAKTKTTETTAKKSPTKKTVSKKVADKKTVIKKSPEKKETTKKESTKKVTTSTAKKTTTKTTSVKKPTTKKTTEIKSTEKKISTKSAPAKKVTEKKTTVKKKVASTKKPTTTKKSTTAAKGSKRDEKIALYIKDIKKHYGEVDEAFVAIIVKNLGPSIYRKDAELVSCSDPKELNTVRRNFLMKKLGIDASQAVLDAAIQDVCTELKGVRTKYRATFYYSLAKKFKKESVLN